MEVYVFMFYFICFTHCLSTLCDRRYPGTAKYYQDRHAYYGRTWSRWYILWQQRLLFLLLFQWKSVPKSFFFAIIRYCANHGWFLVVEMLIVFYCYIGDSYAFSFDFMAIDNDNQQYRPQVRLLEWSSDDWPIVTNRNWFPSLWQGKVSTS